jgi:UDP-N-acetylglucosamine transferase subunit ALG13
VIFVTLGTHEQPFTRALERVAALNKTDEIVIQHGSTTARPDLVTAEWFDYLSYDALLAAVREADVVISHAGVGSIVTAVRNDKKPVVLPRLARFGEHVDDHQLQLARRFAQRGLVVVCRPEDRIEELVARVKNVRPPPQSPRGTRLREAVAVAALKRA